MTRWLSLECLSGDHESCLGRNCSTERSETCECGCHLCETKKRGVVDRGDQSTISGIPDKPCKQKALCDSATKDFSCNPEMQG